MCNDATLQQPVFAELGALPRTRTSTLIGVMANSGVVKLIGRVESFAEKQPPKVQSAEARGLSAVTEEIDDQITKAALESLARNVSVPSDKVRVKVEQRWITLNGEVDWHYQKDAAERSCLQLFGVLGVSNQIAINPDALPSVVHERIMTALKITASAKGDNVPLDGSVRIWIERQLTETAPWDTPGGIRSRAISPSSDQNGVSADPMIQVGAAELK
jgi:osmotically-inducible protein OsmY